jgi:rod shape-determining protein MreD
MGAIAGFVTASIYSPEDVITERRSSRKLVAVARHWALSRGRPHMTQALAAIAAVVAALFELTIAPYLQIGGAHIHLVFVLAVTWTVIAGLESGVVVAFAGGLALDFLAPRPLGSSAFVLLVSVGLAALIGRLLSQLRLRYVAPIIIVAILSPMYSMLLLAVYGAISGPLAVPDPVSLVAPGIALDGIGAAILAPIGLAIHQRATETERFDW